MLAIIQEFQKGDLKTRLVVNFNLFIFLVTSILFDLRDEELEASSNSSSDYLTNILNIHDMEAGNFIFLFLIIIIILLFILFLFKIIDILIFFGKKIIVFLNLSALPNFNNILESSVESLEKIPILSILFDENILRLILFLLVLITIFLFVKFIYQIIILHSDLNKIENFIEKNNSFLAIKKTEEKIESFTNTRQKLIVSFLEFINGLLLLFILQEIIAGFHHNLLLFVIIMLLILIMDLSVIYYVFGLFNKRIEKIKKRKPVSIF